MQIEVEAGTLSHGRARRIDELERERNAYRQCLEDLAGHLDYLQELWGAEGVTRRVVQQVRECLKGESEVSE